MRYQRSALLASACAYALTMAAVANAQTAAPAEKKADAPQSAALEEVVVTGSFIPTLPEDAAIPVDVISYEDLKNLGRPSNVDLVKTLTETGQNIGELDRNNAYPIDAATINLRNLGPRFTTVVLNNRRFPEQYSPAVGRFNNINSIPNAAIGNVEVLKSGGAAIYGADAVAGVVNYITRKNVTGLELNAEYRAIPDADGDYSVDGIWGTKFDGGGNFMVSAGYQHRSRLERLHRDFTNLSYLENPVGWTTYGNPGAYVFQGGGPVPANIVSGSLPTDRQHSATGTIRDPACQAMGGFAGLSSAGSPICYGNYAGIEALTEESDQYSLFAEFNHKLGNLDFHVEGLAYYRDLPNASVLTRVGPLTFPVLGTANGTGANTGLYDRITVSALPSFTSTGLNPAVDYFLRNQFLGSNNAPSYSAGNITAITNPANPGRVALLSSLWVPFGASGNPLGRDYDHQENSTTQFRISTSLGGGLPTFLGTELSWEVALTYHYTKDTRWTLDIPTHKLQNALNGFGGPNCAQNTLTPGGTPGGPGCYFFNPFSSSFATNMYTGAANPYFKGDGPDQQGYDPGRGLQNNLDMVRWLYEPVTLERTYVNTIIDPIISGSTGIGLPGGDMQVAFGGQFRRQDEKVDISDNVDRSKNPCPWLPNGVALTAPGLNATGTAYTAPTSPYTGTSAACTGMMTLSKSTTVLGAQGNNHRDEERHYPVAAAFLEFKLPILNNLNADVVGRYEKFYSDITDIDNDVFVPALALKWDITDWVSLRTSYGETFSQVNPPKDDLPVPANQLAAATVAYTSLSYANLQVQPESGKNFSVGFIFRAGDLNVTLDYNAITIENYTRTLLPGTIVNAALAKGESQTNASALLDCSSPLLSQAIPGLGNKPYIQLNGATCVQGQSRLNTAASAVPGAPAGLVGGFVNLFGQAGQVNSGELVSNALDVSFAYGFNALGGRLMPSINGTYVTKYQFADFIVAGVKLADDYNGVGYANSSSGRLGQGVPEYRLNFGLLYTRDKHTVNVTARYIPSVINDNAADFNASLGRNANIGPTPAAACPSQSITTGIGHVPTGAGTAEYGATSANCNVAPLAGLRVASYFNLDFLYRIQLTDKLDLALNVVNVLDEDPSFARTQLSYDAGYGNPLGRTIEISAGMKF